MKQKKKLPKFSCLRFFFPEHPSIHSITMLLHVLWQNKLVFQACKSNINGLVFVCVSYHLEIINLVKNKNHKWNDEWKLTLIYVNLKVDWVENLRRLKEIMRRGDILEMACWDCSCWWYESRNAPCSKFIPKHEKTFKNWNNRHLGTWKKYMTKSLISIKYQCSKWRHAGKNL